MREGKKWLFLAKWLTVLWLGICLCSASKNKNHFKWASAGAPLGHGAELLWGGGKRHDLYCQSHGPTVMEVSGGRFRHFVNHVTLLWSLQAEEHFICHFLSQSFSVSPNYPSWQPAADSVITSVLLINFHPEIWEGFRTFFRYSYWPATALNKAKLRCRLCHKIKIKIVLFSFHWWYLVSFSNKTYSRHFLTFNLPHSHCDFSTGTSQFLSFCVCGSGVWLSHRQLLKSTG